LDAKDMVLIKQHLKKSTLIIYFIAGFVFIGAVIFSFIYNSAIGKIASSLSGGLPTLQSFSNAYLIGFIIVCFLSFVAIGLYRYAKYHIDLTIYRRRRGEAKPDQPELPKDAPPASSNLIDHANQ
jgi:hypothetical protein